MVRIIEHSTWQEQVITKDARNRITGKKLEWRGEIKVDPSGMSQAELDQKCHEAGERHKDRFYKAASSLGVSMVEVPRDVVHSLQDEHAVELRAICGVSTNDAKTLTKPKTLDIIKLAKKFNITPGDQGWEKKIVKMVLEDKHLASDEEFTEDEE